MTLTLPDGYADFADIDLSMFFFNVITSGEYRPGYNGILCYATVHDDYNSDGCTLVEGTEDGIWSPGETLTIVEGEDAQICVNDGNCRINVGIFFEGYQNFREGYVSVEKVGDIMLQVSDHSDSVESDQGLMTLQFTEGADLDWNLVQIELADWGIVCDNPGASGGDCQVSQHGGYDSDYWENGETLIMNSNGFGFCSEDCTVNVEVYYDGILIASAVVSLK